jgi:hypothetical protein
MARPARLLARTVRAARLVAADRRIPRPLRALLVLGALPIPGPFDEVVLLLVAVPLLVFYRRPMADAWRRAGEIAAPAAPRRAAAGQPARLRGRITVAVGLLAALAWSCLLFGIGLDDLTDGNTKPGVIFSLVLLAFLVAVAAYVLWRLLAPHARRLIRN